MSDAFGGFFRDKSVFITGHTGFKGAWLATWLKVLGARVTGFALPPEPGRPSLFEVGAVAENMISIIGDIRDASLLTSALQQHRPDVVFHLAAQPLVRRSYREPVQTYATNVMGTVNLLEAVRHTPSVRAAVIVTSDKCYQNAGWVWGYRETDPLGGHDPYSASKACAEIVTASYRLSYCSGQSQTAIATARAGNVIGGGDWAEDRLIPDIIQALSRQEPVTLRNPGAVRPWQHVLEPLCGYLVLAERLWSNGPEFSEAWNFGPSWENAITVAEMARRLLQLWGTGDIVVDPAADGLHEARALQLDTSKARARLLWYPALSMDESLELTAAWYRGFLAEPASAPRLLADQISAYMERVQP